MSGPQSWLSSRRRTTTGRCGSWLRRDVGLSRQLRLIGLATPSSRSPVSISRSRRRRNDSSEFTPVLRDIVGERGQGPVFGGEGLYEGLKRAWRYRVERYRLHDIRHTVGTALRRSAGVENGASALGVPQAMIGIYGEHERDARNAALLAEIQAPLGTRGATFPKAAVSSGDSK